MSRKPADREPQFGEPGHWSYYDGPIRRPNGERGYNQGGTHFTLGQADELYVPPLEHPHSGRDYDLSIGVLALNTGEWLALHAREVPKRVEPKDPLGKIGGFALYNRRFPTRDAALRANAGYVLWVARRRFHYEGDVHGGRPWKLTEGRYRQIVRFVYEVLGRPAPELVIAPPPPPPAPHADLPLFAGPPPAQSNTLGRAL